MEAILFLLVYAWNSDLIPGIDLLRSFVTLGREFQFPIDLTANKHFKLTSTPSTVSSYSRDLGKHLSDLCEVASLLVMEQRVYHQEIINLRRPNPKIYSVSDIVFAHQAVHSNAAHGQVDKLSRTSSQVCGRSWLNFMVHPTRLSIAPAMPATRSTHRISLPILLSSFHFAHSMGRITSMVSCITRSRSEAGIKGFTPPTLFIIPNHFLTTNNTLRFTWHTLAELNEEMSLNCGLVSDADMETDMGDSALHVPGLYTGPPPTPPLCSVPTILSASVLAQHIINSAYKLFFISRKIDFSIREWRLVCVALR